MRLPLLNSITPEYISKNIENEHQNIICGNRILIISEPYILFPIDFVKKKFSSNLLSKNTCLLILYFLFAPNEYKILRQSLC